MKNYDFLLFMIGMLISVVLYLVIGGLTLIIIGDNNEIPLTVSTILLVGIPLVSFIIADRVIKKKYNKK